MVTQEQWQNYPKDCEWVTISTDFSKAEVHGPLSPLPAPSLARKRAPIKAAAQTPCPPFRRPMLTWRSAGQTCAQSRIATR